MEVHMNPEPAARGRAQRYRLDIELDDIPPRNSWASRCWEAVGGWTRNLPEMGPQQSMRHCVSYLNSMEYNPPNSVAYRAWLKQQPHGRSWDKWLVMALIGTSVGTTSFLLQRSIQTLFDWRRQLGGYFLNWQMVGGYMLAWFFYVLLSATAALGAAALVVMVAPAAAASGVPHIMAYLNGIRVPKILSFWTFVVKFWSCSLSVAAGLPVGPEGPLVHMGAILGAAFSGMHSSTMHCDIALFRHLRSSKHKRDFVTAGAAAGVAAAFDAPLGGLLFAFEEVASFWHSHLGWQVLFCCVMAVLVQNLLRSLDRELHHTGHFGFFNGNVTFKVGVEVSAHVLTILPASALGAVCGAFAVAFTKLNVFIASWRARVIKPLRVNRLLEVLVVTLIYVGVCMLLPHLFPCKVTKCVVPVISPEAEPDCSLAGLGNVTLPLTNEGLARTRDPFRCRFTQRNEANASELYVESNAMATLINPLGEETISRLFARGFHEEFGYLPLCTLLAWYFLGAAWAAGMDISSGLFVPMLLIGAVLGRLMGLAMVDLLPLDPKEAWLPAAADAQWKWIDPGVFAVVGAAAFMGGVTRLTIALAAIMMEVSSDVQMLLPVLVAILVAKAIADNLEPHSYYHSVMAMSRMPFLPPAPAKEINLDLISVRAVMAEPVQTVPQHMKLADLEATLSATTHNGFPVVAPTAEGLVCLGLIARNHLKVLLEAAIAAGSTDSLEVTFPDLNRHVEDSPDTFVDGNSSPMQGLLGTESLLGDSVRSDATVGNCLATVPLAMLHQELDLSRYINCSTYMVQEDFSLSRAYALFTSMGVRHLVVVDKVNRVRGIITRKDLLSSRLETMRDVSQAEGINFS